MFASLRRHPFGVEAFFQRSFVLTYALPAAVLADLVGPGLSVDSYEVEGRSYGFLAIALVQTRGLRPRGFPRALGRNFFLGGYRIFTRFARPGHPTLRGLRILRSDTDRRSMVFLGNRFTHYNYQLARVRVEATDARLEVDITTPDAAADLHVVADLASRPAPLPEGSPFRSVSDARSFAGPLPFTFGLDGATGKMVVVKGLRTTWDPQPVSVVVHRASFLDAEPFASARPRLANAFYLENVPYSWKPGVLEAFEAPP